MSHCAISPMLILRELMHLTDSSEGQLVQSYEPITASYYAKARVGGKRLTIGPIEPIDLHLSLNAFGRKHLALASAMFDLAPEEPRWPMPNEGQYAECSLMPRAKSAALDLTLD